MQTEHRGPLSAVAVTASLSAAVTLVAIVVPTLQLGYREPSLRVALETASSMIVLLVALLLYGRARRSRRPDELVLALGLVWLAGSNLLLAAVVAFIPTLNHARPIVVASSTVGACLVAAAAVPGSAFASRRLVRSIPVAAAVVTIVLAYLVASHPGHHRPLPAATAPHPSSNLLLLGMQVVATVAFGVAAVAFARRALKTSDTFLSWVAVAMSVACFGRLNYVLYPPIRPQWVYLGDGLRVLCYAVLLVAAIREIRGYWQHAAERAVLDERRRLAQEIHDSIAQELAYIGRRASQLPTGSAVSAEIAAAAKRGLAESRRAITTLSPRFDEPFEVELRHMLDVIEAREHVTVELHVDQPVSIRHEERAALLGIAREAVSNAARHGNPGTIHVELLEGRPVRLRVTDDGSGFDAAEAMGGAGFGLRSMKERALASGADFRITSSPGLGTEIEVVLL
jgi:signal transduction histidine kinase